MGFIDAPWRLARRKPVRLRHIPREAIRLLRHAPRDGLRWVRAVIRERSLRHAPVEAGQPHGLPGRLIISLTSYPARFPKIDLTLRCLLSQDIRPDAVVLWVGEGHAEKLPAEVRALEEHGLVVRECDDSKARSLTKIVPAFQAYPDAFIVIADDDMLYPQGWLRRFVDEYRNPDEVLCQRAKLVTVNAGMPTPYMKWLPAEVGACGADILPIGSGGALYPPGLLPAKAADVHQFATLCPEGDDLWLYWMFVQDGKTARRIRPGGRIPHRRATQALGLHHRNDFRGGNDRQIARLIEAFGLPWGAAATPAASRPRQHSA